MRLHWFSFALSGLVCASLTTFVGCGNDCGNGTLDNGSGACVPSALSCGTGTVLKNSECTPSLTGCSTGTKLEGTVCIPDNAASACGTGSTYDTATGTCVGNAGITCGANTTLVNNVCTAQPPGGGTTTCGAGTVLLDGQCVGESAGCSSAGSVCAYFQLVNDGASGQSVDIYVNNSRVVDDLPYRSATAFAGVVVVDSTATIAVTASDATDATSPLTQSSLSVSAGASLAVVVLRDGSSAFSVVSVPAARAATAGAYQIAVVNGSPDIGSIRLLTGEYDLLTATRNAAGTPLAFGEHTASPVTLPSVTPAFDVFRNNNTTDLLGGYQLSSGFATTGALPLVTTSSTTTGTTALLITSGRDSTSDAALFAITPSGGAFITLDAPARTQLAQLDGGGKRGVYINGFLAKGEFSYGTATPYLPVVAGAAIVLDIYADNPAFETLGQPPPPSTSPLLTTTQTYTSGTNHFVALASGVIAMADFAGRLTSTAAGVDLASFNNESVSVDLSVTIGLSLPTTLADNLATQAYTADYTNVTAGSAVFTVANSNGTNGANFGIDLSSHEGQAGVVVPTGTRASQSAEQVLIVFADGSVAIPD